MATRNATPACPATLAAAASWIEQLRRDHRLYGGAMLEPFTLLGLFARGASCGAAHDIATDIENGFTLAESVAAYESEGAF